jgi:amino acid permease
MNYIKTGLILSTIIIIFSIIILQYKMLEVRTVIDLFLSSAFIINAFVIIKIFKNDKQKLNEIKQDRAK